MILTFHKVASNSPSKWWVSNDKFFSILDSLAGKEFKYLDDYNPRSLNEVVITFDGPYACILEFAVPELNRRNIPFEVYLIGDYVGKDNSFDRSEPIAEFCSLEQLQELKKLGGKLQWHTRSHQISSFPTVEEIGIELDVPKYLRETFPEDFKHFAYPHGKVSPLVKEEVSSRFISAQSVDDGILGDNFEMPRTTVLPDSDFSSTTLSLLLMNYNYAPYILEAHQSVKNQTLKPDRYLIVDDSSTDGSQVVINELIDDAEIRCREKNLGIVDNFNMTMREVNTDYAMFLGADNYLHPEALRELKLILDLNPNVAIAYFDMVLVGPLASKVANTVNADKIGRSIRDNCDLFLWTFPDFSDEQKKLMETTNVINGSAMFRVSAFNEVGGYQKTYPEDHNLWQRILANGHEAIRVPKPLLYYRQHSPSQANTALGKELELSELRRKIKELENALYGSDKELNIQILGKIVRSTIQNIGLMVQNPKMMFKLFVRYFLMRLPNSLRETLIRQYRR